MSEPTTTGTLQVSGARLYYEIRGSGPLLALLGAPAPSVLFTAVASLLAHHYTVLTYDPRGIARSTVDNPDADATPVLVADDVSHLLATLTDQPAYVFGSSGGATTGLALLTRHPEQVRTLIAHEPPLPELLPDRAQQRAAFDDIYDTFCQAGHQAAWQKFLAVTGMTAGPLHAPEHHGFTPHQGEAGHSVQIQVDNTYFFSRMMRPFTRYEPNLAALRAAPNRVVVAAGATSAGQLPHQTAATLAEQLHLALITLPGGHAGTSEHPQPSADALRHVLDTDS